MSSSVFFKFKSQKEPQRVAFDGTGISVFELKRDIISISRLGDGTDFDLAIYNPDTNEEYNDDTAIVSRGTTVVARRLPAAKPGAGRAARYVSGKMPVTAKNQHRIEASRVTPQTKQATSSGDPGINNSMSEEEKIAAMFAQGGEQWEQQQQHMATQKAIHRSGFQKPQPVPDKPLPAGYTCHRCGEKGHWIQACPTNNDPNFDNRPKFRKTTGIPRSFLKVVDKPTALADDGSVDVSKLPAGVMYTATGEWVVAEPDKEAWDKFQAKTKASADKTDGESSDQELRDLGLECPIDKRPFVDPMKTPCCGQTYCRDCIENALLSSDFVCPNCSTDNVLVDNLESDEAKAKQLQEYQDGKAAAQRDEKAKSASPTPSEADASKTDGRSPLATTEKVPLPTAQATTPNVAHAAPASTVTSGTSPAPGTPQAAASGSKKRPAEEELDNKRIPTGPAAMRKTQPDTKTATPNNMNDFVQQMNAMAQQQGTNGFNFNNMPNMPNMPNMNMNMNGMGGFPNMMGMPNPMMLGMPNPMMMNGWNGMGMNMNFPQQGMYGGGHNNQNFGVGQGQWQGNQGWAGHGQQARGPQGMGNAVDGDAYMRKPLNQNRQQNRSNRRQRSVDYREMGS